MKLPQLSQIEVNKIPCEEAAPSLVDNQIYLF